MTPPIVYLSPVVRHRACVSAIAIVILETDLLNEGGGGPDRKINGQYPLMNCHTQNMTVILVILPI